MAYPRDLQVAGEEGVQAFMRGLSDAKLAESLIAGAKRTVQECIEALSETERYRQAQGRAATAVRVRQMEDRGASSQPPNSPRRDRRQGGQQGQAQNNMNQGKPWTSDFRPLVSCVDRLSREMAEMRRNQQPGPMRGPPPPGRPQGYAGVGRGRGRGRDRGIEYPSTEQPCNVCGSPEHWAWRCPDRPRWNNGAAQEQNQNLNRQQGNERGLDPRSEGQSPTNK